MSMLMQMEIAALKANLKAQGDDNKRLADLLTECNKVIAWRDYQLAEYADIAALKQNLMAFSDTFHIAAERLKDKELAIFADQLLTVVGLKPRG